MKLGPWPFLTFTAKLLFSKLTFESLLKSLKTDSCQTSIPPCLVSPSLPFWNLILYFEAFPESLNIFMVYQMGCWSQILGWGGMEVRYSKWNISNNIWQFLVAKVSVLMRSVMNAEDADMAGHAGPGVIAPGHSIYWYTAARASNEGYLKVPEIGTLTQKS